MIDSIAINNSDAKGRREEIGAFSIVGAYEKIR